MSVFRTALLTAVAEGGTRRAVIEDEAAWSYADLDRWSADLARAMEPSAKDRQQCAALLLPNGASWLAAYLAVLRADMVAVPLNPALTGVEIGRILERIRPRVVLCPPGREPEVRELAGRLCPWQPQVRTVGPLPPVDGAQGQGRPWPSAERGPQSPCLVMHTSGSTGSPKGLLQTEQALHLSTGYWRHQHRCAADVVALPIPLAHTYGHLVAASTLLSGAALILTPEAFDPQRWAARLNRHQATVLEAVPTVYARLLAAVAPAVGPGRLRRCLSAGQQAPADLRDSWQERTGVPLLESWGMTELAGPGLGPAPGTCPGSAGVAVPGLETRLVVAGPEGAGSQGTIARPGEVGELWVRGPQVTPGHRTSTWHVAPVCDGQGWLHTGDLAVRDEHGCIRLTGRSKDVVITRGYNVYPAEVEAVLREHPGVADAAVVGRADRERGESVHAVVVAVPDGPAVSAEELLEHCRGRLARYKVPRSVEFVRRLPLSGTGKLDRAALRTPLAALAGKEG